MRSRHCCPGF